MRQKSVPVFRCISDVKPAQKHEHSLPLRYLKTLCDILWHKRPNSSAHFRVLFEGLDFIRRWAADCGKFCWHNRSTSRYTDEWFLDNVWNAATTT
mmetsp:Transcript_28059/g.65914  ORF Transcript_28059/g.65914 Transcript_28059/m.65914 type:complete len:95 (+) Transcript_28059:115-399(+)